MTTMMMMYSNNKLFISTAPFTSKPRRVASLVLLVVLLCLVSQTTARALAITGEIKDTDLSTSIDFNAPLDIDTSEPPTINEGEWILLSPEQAELKHGLRKRADDDDAGKPPKEITAAPSGSVTTTFQIAVSTITEKPTTTATSTAAQTTETGGAVSSSLPKFFDGSLSANFAPNSNCPAFLNSFLNNQTFNQCYPISLLMQVCLPHLFPSPLFHPLLPSVSFFPPCKPRLTDRRAPNPSSKPNAPSSPSPASSTPPAHPTSPFAPPTSPPSPLPSSLPKPAEQSTKPGTPSLETPTWQ